MSLIDQLLTVIDAYRACRGLSVSRVSFLVFGDGKVVGGLISGNRDLTTRRLEAALAWMSDNWPGGVDWPSDVVRPVARNSTSPFPQDAEA